jgi:hypothetical protein
MDCQKRKHGTQHARPEDCNFDRNWNLDRGARYWNCLSEDLVLGGQEETKVLYRRKYTRGYVRKVNKERKSFRTGTNSPLKYTQCSDHLGTAATHIALPLKILTHKIRTHLINLYYLHSLPRHSPICTVPSHDLTSVPDL